MRVLFGKINKTHWDNLQIICKMFCVLEARFTKIWPTLRFYLACMGECLAQWGGPVALPSWLAGPYN